MEQEHDQADGGQPGPATDAGPDLEPTASTVGEDEVAVTDPGDEIGDALAGQLADELASDDDGPASELAGDMVSLPAAEYENLQHRLAEVSEQLLRERADFDNTRKRLRREADAAGARAVGRFVRPLLVELDNFGHALEAANPEKFQDFALGVTMIRENLVRLLGDHGVEPVSTEGRFDPAWHEVVAEVESEAEKGTILDIQRQGYRMGDQVLRAAQVVVAKGPAEATGD